MTCSSCASDLPAKKYAFGEKATGLRILAGSLLMLTSLQPITCGARHFPIIVVPVLAAARFEAPSPEALVKGVGFVGHLQLLLAFICFLLFQRLADLTDSWPFRLICLRL